MPRAGIRSENQLRHGEQVGHWQHWQPSPESQTLRDARREAHAGEAARPPTKCDRIELPERDARIAEQGVDHGQQLAAMATRHFKFARGDLAIEVQRR